MNNKVAVVIQARMGSSRFPGKVLAPLAGIPVISHVIRHVCEAHSGPIVVAIPNGTLDLPLAHFLKVEHHTDVTVYRGSADNVLQRFYEAAKATECGIIVRITADCPLLDSKHLRKMITAFVDSGELFYISWTNDPDGNDVEVMRFEKLQELAKENKPEHREHVTTGFPKSLQPLSAYADVKYSVDTVEDLRTCEDLIEACGIGASFEEYAAAYRQMKAATQPAKALTATKLRAVKPLYIRHSNALLERSRQVIPGATQTASKGAERFCAGFGPAFISEGDGCMVTDLDGNEYIDWPMGLGAVILGHGDQGVVEAVTNQIYCGNSFSLPTVQEVVLAERLCEWIPCAEQVRFMRNGSDATTACIRLARAYSEKEHIVRCGYHGWHDWALDPAYGNDAGVQDVVQQYIHSVTYNDLEELEEAFQQWSPAGFILEPVSLTPPSAWYLKRARELCDSYNVVFIFDEVITGIRMAKGGAQEAFHVEPDLCAIGKGMANGFPLSAVCGKRAIMHMFNETHISGTHFGEVSAIAAALATMETLEKENFWAHQAYIGTNLGSHYQAAVVKHGMIEHTTWRGLPHYQVAQWNDLAHFTLFQQEMLRRGILFSGSHFPSLAHNIEHVKETGEAFNEAMGIVARAIRENAVERMLECPVNKVVFRRH